MASINFDVNSNSVENKSQVVLRTNPHLTSNVKLVVDSNGELYLDSISANRVLSNQKYKKFPLDSKGHYAYDIAQFYKNTPLDKAYEVWNRDSNLSVFRDYNKQYEEQYQYGSRLNDSKLYDDNIRFFAPIWLDQDLPEYFVIYRINEPVSKVGLTDTYDGINGRVMQMLNNAELIKTFDLRQGSKLGDYLNTYVNDPKFPTAPLTVSFEKDQKTSWNGIDLVKGGFTSKGEYIFEDFAVTDRQEILNNQYITEGFKRNTMVCANLLNLEFIFDDPTARPYDVHRYVGFYVKAHAEGRFQAGSIRKGILKVLASTVETEYDLTGTSLTPISMLPNDDLGLPVLQWVRNRGVFYNVLNTSTGSLELKVAGMSDDTQVTGKIQKPETLQVEGAVPALKDFIKLNVIDSPLNGERWVIANKGEWNTIGDENYFTITADGSIPAGGVQGQRFSNQGTLQQIAHSILQAINNIQDNPLRVTRDGSSLIIEHNSIGNRLYRSFFGSHSTNALDPFEIEVGEFDNVTKKLGLDTSVYTDWNVYYPIGGSNSGIGFLISETEVGDIDTNTYIRVKTGDFYKIIDIVKDPYYTDLYRVCLSASKTRPELLFDTSFNLYVDSYVDWGKFEVYDFIDFDFNFNSTDNNDPKELRYEDYSTEVVDEHFNTPSDFNNSVYSSYFKQLEGINTGVTAFGSGAVNIASEYDRLKENYLTSTSTLSRVVPTINKWVYKDSVNAKDKPYFLSTSESFGKTNFSPDITVSGRLPQSMTHEWFYLYKYPQYPGIPQTQAGMGNVVRSFYSYLQPEETINLTATDLQDVNDNWFERLFTYEGIEMNGDWIPTVPSKKWSNVIKGSSVSPAETMFRGLKVKFYSRKEFTESNPRNLLTNSDFNGYKFSAVLNYNGQQSEDSIVYKVIQNKKWKTVTFYVEVNSSDEFLSSVNHKLMYELNHFLTASPIDFISSNMTGYLDWETAQTVGTRTTVYGEGTFFNREIQVGPTGGYGSLEFQFSGYTFQLQILDVLGDNRIVVETSTTGSIFDTTSSIELSLGSIFNPAIIDYTYLQGGYNLGTSTFEAVGINYIAGLVNLNDTNTIQYITVEEDGTLLNNRFIINIEDGNDFVKKSRLRVEADPNKPKSYKVSSGLVGYINTELSTPVNVNLIRMGGDYTPLARKVVWFTDIYKNNKLDQSPSTATEERQQLVYNRFNRLGISFGSYVNLGSDSYGLIKDYYFHKVNPDKADGILKLSQSGDGAPVYPLINEVAIDKRNFNVFRSSWEDGFYVNNDTQSLRQFVFGTLSAHEESSFLASTLNLPRDSYDLTSFNAIRRGNAFEELQNIKRLNNYNGDVVMWEDSSNVWIDLYLKNRVTEILTLDGAGRSLLKYVDVAQSYGDKSTLNDDIKEYIEVNLLKLMGIEQVRLWNKPSKTINQSELLSADSLQQILDTNISEEKSFRVEYDPNHPLNVRLIYNKRPGFRHQFYVYVKISS
jgi:hypothetical protein